MRHDTGVEPDAISRPRSAPRRGAPLGPRRLLAVLLGLTVVLGGCTSRGSDSGQDLDAARQAAAGLAAGLTNTDLTHVAFTGATGFEVDALFQPLLRGMGPVPPKVEVRDVTASGTAATATLGVSWTFPGVPQPWAYTTTAQLSRTEGQWKPTWAPAVLAPQLDGANRLSQHRLYPERGELRGEQGDPIVTSRAVVRIGIDTSELAADRQPSSARRLAKLVGIDPTAYAKRVQAAGKSAFVEAIILRAADDHRPANNTVAAIPGALAIDDDLMLAPSHDFARALIGSVGDATAEIVQASKGAVVTGDQVGLSGLEKRYDAQLRGTPGVQVQIVPDPAQGGSSSGASPSASPSASATASPSADPGASTTVFEVKPVAGKPLTTTLNVDLQKVAERIVAGAKPAAALVALRPSTGAVLAAANNAGANGQALATTGQIAPGSTFKVASSLALLRAGLTPDSKVSCPKTVDVDGRTYKNYNDYPSGHLGTIPLRTAVAQSCNTAFVGQRDKLGSGDLAAAAASLGLGTDYDVGFPSFFGQVPKGGSETAKAEAMFGQGTVLASPLAMAAVASSVQAGHTVLPNLIEGQKATSTATPITKQEAAQLKQMMRAVVTSGSGGRLESLPGPAVIAKTGTAEYGSKAPLKTHAWMIAAQGDLAVAVFVQDGDSGSGTAGPLLESFLRQAG
jgi:cell division protein FtsI/penicillin-binding protein 2